MFETIIAISLGLVAIVIFILYQMHSHKKTMTKIEATLQEVALSYHFALKRVHKNTHDFEMEDEKRIYLFKVVIASPSYEIVITNQQRWYLNVIRDISKASKEKRIISEIIPFTTLKVHHPKQAVKVAIIYPKVQKIVRYINESEMVFVTPKIDVWGYKVINYSKLVEEFNLL